MFKKSKAHLDHVHEGYFQHMGLALYVAFTMIVGGLMCLVHAFIPALFQTCASQRISKLHETFIARLHN
jgi:hypothetical protein